MNILALDTSTEYLSLALLRGEERYTRELLAGQTHSLRILPLLRELLDEAGVEMQALDGIAFGAGPGSFTGLRIGCGVAQGLAFGAGLPVIGVSTLLAVAAGAARETGAADLVLVCLDARMGEVYHAAYVLDGGDWREEIAPGLYKPDAVPGITGTGWIAAGSGWATYDEALHAAYGTQVGMVMPTLYPRALDIAVLALPGFEAGKGRPAAEAAPIYIRNKVALKISERPKMAGLK